MTHSTPSGACISPIFVCHCGHQRREECRCSTSPFRISQGYSAEQKREASFNGKLARDVWE